MNALLPFLPFAAMIVGIRCLFGMWETGRARRWEEFARWSMGLFAVGAVMAVASMMLEG